MPTAKRAHTTTLSILNTAIRRDAAERYCLNDCWAAAGKPEEKKPSNWNDLLGTKELVEEICQSENLTFGGKQPLFVKRGGNAPGIWACKELVYAYAMWISPAFHLRVIRAFDAMMQGTALPPPVDAVAAHKQAAAIFRSLNHVGKLTGMSREDAARAANAAAKQHTGIDLLAELKGGLQVPSAGESGGISVTDAPSEMKENPISGHLPSDEKLLICMTNCDAWDHVLSVRPDDVSARWCRDNCLKEVLTRRGIRSYVEQARQNWLQMRQKSEPLPKAKRRIA